MAPLKTVSSQDACRRVQRPVVTAAAEPKREDFELRAAQAWTRAASMECFLLTSRRNHFLAVGVIGRNDVSNKSVAPCIPAPIVKIPDVLKSVSIILWLPLTSHRLRSTSGGSTSQPPAVCRGQVLPRVCRATMPLQPPAVCGAKVLPRV